MAETDKRKDESPKQYFSRLKGRDEAARDYTRDRGFGRGRTLATPRSIEGRVRAENNFKRGYDDVQRSVGEQLRARPRTQRGGRGMRRNKGRRN